MPWVKKAMEFVDEKKAIKTASHPIFSASTFETESTLNTTSHWNTTG